MNAVEDGQIKATKRCFTCKCKVRCRNEKVERGSKKCLNLIALMEKGKLV